MSLLHVNQVSLFGERPINIAATRGSVSDMTALVSAGASVNSAGEHGYTPLHNAVEQGMLDAVKWLLAQGADRLATNDWGMTPRDLAADLDEQVLFELLGLAHAAEQGKMRGSLFPSELTRRFDSIMESETAQGRLLFLAPYIEQGEPEALFLSSTFMCHSEASEERRISALREAAELGYIPALFTLGMDQLFGDGVEQDVGAAARCFERAAQAGLPAGMYEWGLALVHGKGVQENVPRGMLFIHCAAADGDEYAQEFLAAHYGPD